MSINVIGQSNFKTLSDGQDKDSYSWKVQSQEYIGLCRYIENNNYHGIMNSCSDYSKLRTEIQTYKSNEIESMRRESLWFRPADIFACTAP